MVQAIDNASQISAVKFVVAYRSTMPWLGTLRVIGGIPIAEPVRKYLIPDRTGYPVGSVVHIDIIDIGKHKGVPVISRGTSFRFGIIRDKAFLTIVIPGTIGKYNPEK